MKNEFEEVGLLARENPGTVVMGINLFGGKDSMRMLGLVREEFPELPMISVMADTGFEHEFPISAEAWGRRRSRVRSITRSKLPKWHRGQV